MNGAELLLGSAALERHGARVALICGEDTVSFAEMASLVARSSAAFAALGVRPGDRVLMLMRDTPEFAAAWLGAVRAGAVPVALNNQTSQADYRHIAADSGARLALVEEVSAAAPAEPGLAEWRAALRAASPLPPFDAAPEAPAFMLYSSGTTGRPKGIVHVHRSFVSLGAAFRTIGLAAGERVFTTSKFFFAYGLEHGLVGALSHGLTSILYPDWPDSPAVIDVAARHRPAALFGVPTVYRRLLAEPRAALAALREVRHFVAAGEALSSQLVEQWRAATGGELLSLYGMSETFCACMMTPPGTSNGARTGMPFPGVEVRLRDAQGAEPGASSEPGVLWLRHPAQASGYANLPEQTREQFKDGWFCSRDLFVRDAQGHFVHQGRSDELLKVAGQWVQPGEVEELAGLAPAVAEAACVPVPDADGLARLALFVTATGDPAAAQRAAEEACERGLPRYKRPKWVRAVAELPRTATGKVQRFKLREILERELSGKD
jgi:acyl-coenzyme A synthetase/AMP-(fatty) acid ligase